MSSFCVASSCSKLTGGHGGGGDAFPREGCPRPHPRRAERIPRECQARRHQWLSYTPSAINSFASLGTHLGEIKCRNCNEANRGKETAKTGPFGYNSVLDLNTKNMDNSPSFLSVTHTILSAKRFRCYRISKIDFAADFCFWAEQRLNET
jgi:hypothetical protein